MQYGVMSIPTMILYKDGKPVKQVVGAKPKPALMRDIEPYLQQA
jgi:thioredoxin 1